MVRTWPIASAAAFSAGLMADPELTRAMTPLIDALEQMGIAYAIVGSVASSAHGIPRTTLDADLVVDLQPSDVAPLVAAIESSYYVDAEAVVDAVRRKSMVNIVHLDTMLKVDVYVLTSRPFDRDSFRRRSSRQLDDTPGARAFFLASPEDTVLNKLAWYSTGGEVSERQWSDVIGVIKVQTRADALDLEYLRRWAASLRLTDLLERALAEAASP